jgi:hypothetical protein
MATSFWQKSHTTGNEEYTFESSWHVLVLPSDDGSTDREWTTCCAQTSLCWWPYTELVVYKAKQHSYMQTATIGVQKCIEVPCTAMSSTEWLYPAVSNSCKVGTDIQKCRCELVTCNTIHVLCLFTDMSVTITEQCLAEVRCWTVTELAEPLCVCMHAGTSEFCQINIQQYMIRLNFL